jgi:subfamily B ATP-binding cassette protein MsbA
VRYQSLVQPISQTVASSTIIILVIVAVQYLVLPGILELTFLLTFLFALFRLMPVVHSVNNLRGTWAQNRPGLANVADLISSNGKPALPSGDTQAPSLRKSIEFEGVSFAYIPDTPVLKDITLSIHQGRTTAIVGASGAGKSTLADLVPRFYDPTAGQVLYDGTDLRAFDLYSLRDRIGIVSQSTYMFNDTVCANIAYGRPDASMDEVVAAAENANALHFIQDLEEGFDTMLGNRLSGGQRQRLAIARALLQNPEILILDEATSDLDSISERLVQQSLERLMSGRTVIAIAHRLSTIENADWVVVLEEGRVAEQGRYDDLVEKQGHLWKYHKIQYQIA